MNAVNGVILIMVGIFGLYLLWAANSPLFKRTTASSTSGADVAVTPHERTYGEGGIEYERGADGVYRPVNGVSNDAADNTVGPAENAAYYDEGTQAPDDYGSGPH